MHDVGYFVVLVNRSGVQRVVGLLNERQVSRDDARTGRPERDYELAVITGYVDFAADNAFDEFAHPCNMG